MGGAVGLNHRNPQEMVWTWGRASTTSPDRFQGATLYRGRLLSSPCRAQVATYLTEKEWGKKLQFGEGGGNNQQHKEKDGASIDIQLKLCIVVESHH